MAKKAVPQKDLDAALRDLANAAAAVLRRCGMSEPEIRKAVAVKKPQSQKSNAASKAPT